MTAKFAELAAAAGLLLLASACERNPAEQTARAESEFVGGAVCAGCHAAEAELWPGSQHDRAMQVADASTVLGDFDDAEFGYGAITSRFFRRDGAFWVNTDGPDGSLADFEIRYTFGVTPLQQYLVELPGNRYQVLPIAWDSRPAAQGGGRWFHLYPDEAVTAGDALHWSGRLQNWNANCAECHSTNLVKGYDVDEDSFATSWTDVDVNCEACHGPGSAHVADPAAAPMRLGHVERAWVQQGSRGIAMRVPAATNHDEVEACAPCHARRSQFAEGAPGGSLLNAFRPALLDTDAYFADGQIRDEVYVYGSFLQSAMYAAGVTCSDCHDPHSAELRADLDVICNQCHLPERFATSEHHHHAADSDGARCVECHMPARDYMIVDPRRDHSFRVPRPDLSDRLGVPNACNGCHDDRSAAWAAAAVASWYPNGRNTRFHYGEALHAGRAWAAERAPLLDRVIADATYPAIVRATALALRARSIDDAALDSIERAANDPEPLVDLAALEALGDASPAFKANVAQRFLDAPERALRIEAAHELIPATAELSERRRDDWRRALDEYRDAQTFNMDRASGWLNWGTTVAALGRADEAERSLRTAIAREPAFTASYVNLADLLRSDGREAEARALLDTAISRQPEDPALELARGFSLVREGDLDEALAALERAAELAPESPYYRYVLGVALRSSATPQRGIEVLESTAERFPGYPPALLALATMLRDDGRAGAALEYARRLVALVPTDASARSLLVELESAR